MQNPLFETGVALGFDAQQVGGLLQADLVSVMAADHFLGESVADVSALVEIPVAATGFFFLGGPILGLAFIKRLANPALIEKATRMASRLTP